MSVNSTWNDLPERYSGFQNSPSYPFIQRFFKALIKLDLKYSINQQKDAPELFRLIITNLKNSNENSK